MLRTEFFREQPAGKCANCGCHNPAVKQFGNTKLFMMSLKPAARAANASRGVEIKPVGGGGTAALTVWFFGGGWGVCCMQCVCCLVYVHAYVCKTRPSPQTHHHNHHNHHKHIRWRMWKHMQHTSHTSSSNDANSNVMLLSTLGIPPLRMKVPRRMPGRRRRMCSCMKKRMMNKRMMKTP